MESRSQVVVSMSGSNLWSRSEATVILRQAFDHKLNQIQDEVLVLGSMVERALVETVDALIARDIERGWELLTGIDDVGRKRAAIEADALVLMSTQQPVAGDLRSLVAVLEISAELKRIGEHIEEIGKLAMVMSARPVVNPATDLSRMVAIVHEMLRDALTAYARRDLALAQAVPPMDDRVDALYERMNQDVPTCRIWEYRFHSLKVAHNLERIADRVVNVCEWIMYAITGKLVELS